MNSDQNVIEFVKQAQLGDRECMARLSELAQGKLCAYIYRVTLDQDLTSDLVQETLLQMVKSLESLQKPESFWGWLYRIAMNKIQQYYRQLSLRKTQVASDFERDILGVHASGSGCEGERRLEGEEMMRKVFTAMAQLKQRDRAVLSLRCFEEMPYSEIASVLECSDMNARLLFYRAKLALKQKLGKYGIGSSALLAALGLFGRLTAPAEAAGGQGAVSAASVKVGIGTVVAGYVGTKLGVVISSAVVFTAVAVGTVGALKEEKPGLTRENVTSFHYTEQARDTSAGAVSSLSKGAYEQWYYFPEGVDGALFRRMQRWTPDQTVRLCSWLQNGDGNYYYFSGGPTIYITNYHLWRGGLRTMRLPSDSPVLAAFLDEMEGAIAGVEQERDGNGLLAGMIDRRFADARDFQTEYTYNTIAAEFFAYNWPAEVPVEDQRDEMHTRGWTYYEISGEMNGQPVKGGGVIPFVYHAVREHPAWLRLEVGEDWRYVDSRQGAYVCRADGECVGRFPAGTFMKGWMRPWMGLHVVDLVRRDAAAARLRFETVASGEEGNEHAEIFVYDDRSEARLKYAIDMEDDRMDDIEFDWPAESGGGGAIHFRYYDDIRTLQNELVEPVELSGAAAQPAIENAGMGWLFRLGIRD